MIKNIEHKQYIENIAIELEEDKLKGLAATMLETIYDLGVKEGKLLTVKNAVEFLSK